RRAGRRVCSLGLDILRRSALLHGEPVRDPGVHAAVVDLSGGRSADPRDPVAWRRESRHRVHGPAQPGGLLPAPVLRAGEVQDESRSPPAGGGGVVLPAVRGAGAVVRGVVGFALVFAGRGVSMRAGAVSRSRHISTPVNTTAGSNWLARTGDSG